jgi:hypothetical protein
MCQMLTSRVIGIKLLNTLPPNINSLNQDIKVFKPASKDYLLSPSTM